MTKKYKHKLTKGDLKHMRRFNLMSMVKLKSQMKQLVKHRKTTTFEPCFECKSIAGKLGLPV